MVVKLTLSGALLMMYVAAAEPVYEVDAAFVPLTVNPYEPSAVPTGEVTVRVAEPLLPGDSDNEAVFHTADQPDGNASAKLKVAAAHEEVSLSVTVAVKLTGVPDATYWLWDGEMVRVGLAAAQTAPNVI